MKYLKTALFIFLGIIFAANLTFRIFSYSKEYTTRFDASYWKSRYLESQWVVSGSRNSIGDDGLYAYAGWNYITGGNPVLLNAEIPPLGKYIIGAGEVIFQNQNILILLIGLSCLWLFYVLNLQLFKDKLLAFVPVFLFSLDPLYYSQLRAPYLDTMYLFFLLLTLLFAMRRKYFLSAFFLGCFANMKFPAGSLFLFVPLIVFVLLFDKKHLKKFLLSLVLWPLVFLLSYSSYFIHGGNLFTFFGVQKYIIHFYATGVKSTPGIVYPMILFGRWYTWFAGVQPVTEWTILWPFSFIATIFASIPLASVLLRHGKKPQEYQNFIMIFFWVLSYLVFLTFTPVFPRYLLLLLPFMYNLTIWFLAKYVYPRY